MLSFLSMHGFYKGQRGGVTTETGEQYPGKTSMADTGCTRVIALGWLSQDIIC